jgi:exonuclease VII small subunit
MVPVSDLPLNLVQALAVQPQDLDLQVPDPTDAAITDHDFLTQVETAWQVCDRFDLQTEIWRGRILKVVRDREKHGGEGRGIGFLNWLQNHEISKTQAYRLMDLANSADSMIADGVLDPDAINQFSKSAFFETAQAEPEVQQLISEAARDGKRITRREVRQLSDDWTAMSSDLIPAEIKSKAADNSIPSRYLAPLARELEKIPSEHQVILQDELSASPDVETLKQVTSEAKHLAKYLEAATHVQALEDGGVNLEEALEEALRLGCLNTAADLVHQAAQLEQTMAKLHTTWKRLGKLSDRLYVDSGASTPQLRSLLQSLERLTGETLELAWGSSEKNLHPVLIRLKVLTEAHERSEET